MRAKVILIASVLALALLAPALYFRFKPESPAAPAGGAPAVAADDSAPAAAPIPKILKRVSQNQAQEGLPSRPDESDAVDHQTYVLQRRAELAELGMRNDKDSLKTVLSEMENPDPEIRKAALNATIDFGSKDAIPTLQNELNWATDPQEKVDIQKAIDFLELPSLGSDENGSVTQQSTGDSMPPN